MGRVCKAAVGVLMLLLSLLLLAAGLGAPLLDGGTGSFIWSAWLVWMATGVCLGAVGLAMLARAGLIKLHDLA